MTDTQKGFFLMYSKLLFEYYKGQQRPDFFLTRMSTILDESKTLLKKQRRVTFSEDCKKHDGLSPPTKLFKEFLDDIFNSSCLPFGYVRNLYRNGKQDELKIIETMLIDLIKRCEALPNNEATTATLNVGSVFSQGANRGCITFFKQNLKKLRSYILR